VKAGWQVRSRRAWAERLGFGLGPNDTAVGRMCFWGWPSHGYRLFYGSDAERKAARDRDGQR
jgi:hypothetical protein